ncbi:sigma-70 family RNA polymerase sigma factor [Actinoplanes aureus]|uniref:RNA polymerase sigma factor n=1 Tax=Actinoplanes aureus TaxID=2792083 RepID=A0A931C7L0_9ACTN|nr:sigma-70 family RNA polymerase sigma factor [Actinoplanes aureus]MBG0563659.1 sigma-70 family RNA polymerase sigma factor [Actinoplanes aureus]
MDNQAITAAALAAGQGCQASAATFIRATQAEVHRFLVHLVGPREADDLAQETYLRALRSLPRFAARSSARTWLFSIARRVAVDHVRAAMARPRIVHVADWRATVETHGPAVDARIDEQTALRQLLDGLAPERREAFLVTQMLGLSYAEAAEVCGCPVGTIRSRVARARADLVAAMAANTSEPARRRSAR